MRDLPVVVLLTLSLIVACGGEKAVREPAADGSQSAASEPAGTTSPVGETVEAPSAEDAVAGTTEVGEAAGEVAEPASAPKGASEVKGESVTPPPEAGPREHAAGAAEEMPSEEVTPAQASLVSEGSAIFGRRCATCHAKDGSGDTAMGRRQNIPSLASDQVQHLSDEELQKLIHEGAGAVSKQAHQNKLQNDHEMRAVIAWIRSLE